MFSILNKWFPDGASPERKGMKTSEQMFNRLNRPAKSGKQAAMLCKILDRLSKLSHGLRGRFMSTFYVIERRGFGSALSAALGLRIAFSILQPSLIRVRTGKD